MVQPIVAYSAASVFSLRVVNLQFRISSPFAQRDHLARFRSGFSDAVLGGHSIHRRLGVQTIRSNSAAGSKAGIRAHKTDCRYQLCCGVCKHRLYSLQRRSSRLSPGASHLCWQHVTQATSHLQEPSCKVNIRAAVCWAPSEKPSLPPKITDIKPARRMASVRRRRGTLSSPRKNGRQR